MLKNTPYLAADWKTGTHDHSPFIPHSCRFIIMGCYLIALMALGASGYFVYGSWEANQKAHAVEVQMQATKESIAETSKKLALIRDGSAKSTLLALWIADELRMQSLVFNALECASHCSNKIKINTLSVNIPSNRQLLTLELDIIGANNLISDYFEALVRFLNTENLEVINFQQPRITGGYKLIMNLRHITPESLNTQEAIAHV